MSRIDTYIPRWQKEIVSSISAETGLSVPVIMSRIITGKSAPKAPAIGANTGPLDGSRARVSISCPDADASLISLPDGYIGNYTDYVREMINAWLGL